MGSLPKSSPGVSPTLHPTTKLIEAFPTKVLSSIPIADYPPGPLGIHHPRHPTSASQTRPPSSSPFAGWASFPN